MEETVPISEPGVLLEDEGDQRGIKITGLRFKVRVRESKLLNAGYIARLMSGGRAPWHCTQKSKHGGSNDRSDSGLYSNEVS
jgi:hypothetical protein